MSFVNGENLLKSGHRGDIFSTMSGRLKVADSGHSFGEW